MKDRLLFLLALGGLAAPAGAAQTFTNATHQGQRYLFIVDTSASMKRMEAAVRVTLHDLIFAGFNSVKDVTVILVTDGSALLRGTPYDEPINRVYHQAIQSNRRPAKPFITLLVARHGVIDTWQVHPPGERITLPLLPEPEAMAQASPPLPTHAAATPAPSPSSKPNEQQPKPAVADRPPTPPANSPAKAVKPSPEPAPGNAEEPKTAPTPPAEVAKPKPVAEANAAPPTLATPTNQPGIKTSTPPTDAVSPPVITPPEVTPVPVTPANFVDTSASKTNVPEAAAPNLATAVLPANQFSPAGMLIMAVVLLVLACGLGWWLLRRRRSPQPSLISQSMNRKPK